MKKKIAQNHIFGILDDEKRKKTLQVYIDLANRCSYKRVGVGYCLPLSIFPV